ncbi:MAG: DUF4430 domain-containing protein [Eubacterium sp.]|nr:DUF4430 domain-containing protein [Eubacterium sp.]
MFDVLKSACSASGIALEFSESVTYATAYVEGIGGLYEFDCGSLSGWMFRVNGSFPNYGASAIEVSDGDRIEWLYTCNMGDDL